MVPGSVFLKATFALMAVVLILAAADLVRRGSLACGDDDALARRRAWRFLVLSGIWVAAALALAASGVLGRFDATPPPFLLLLPAIVVLGLLIARSTLGDRLARGVPLAVLVAFQGFRLPLELMMHRAYTEGLMPVQMSYSGRNFDIVTGATALVLAAVMMRRDVPRGVVAAWNVLGLALLVNIVTVAVVSTPRFQYFGPDRLNVWVTWPPYVLLPTVMVLAAWAGHLVIIRALSAHAQKA
ncbi:MAG: hypothetical protein AB1635_20765 [Acidobacteriota bacterium]